MLPHTSIKSDKPSTLPFDEYLYALTFCPTKTISETPCSINLVTSSKICSGFLLTSSPLVYGTTQKEQYFEQPSMIDTKLETPVASGWGNESNFSTMGNETSTAWILFPSLSKEGTL